MNSLRRAAESAPLLFLLAVAGCSRPGSHLLGRAPEGAAIPLDVARHTAVGTSVTVKGVMVEKCPEAGCWFVLKDATGTLRVDTKTAGFVVLEVPLRQTVSVSGELVTNGAETLLAATGVRY